MTLCEETRARLEAGEPADERHLAFCPDCRALAAGLEADDALFRAVYRDGSLPPADLSDVVARARRRRVGLRVPAFATAVAVGLFLVFAGIGNGPSGPAAVVADLEPTRGNPFSPVLPDSNPFVEMASLPIVEMSSLPNPFGGVPGDSNPFLTSSTPVDGEPETDPRRF